MAHTRKQKIDRLIEDILNQAPVFNPDAEKDDYLHYWTEEREIILDKSYFGLNLQIFFIVEISCSTCQRGEDGTLDTARWKTMSLLNHSPYYEYKECGQFHPETFRALSRKDIADCLRNIRNSPQVESTRVKAILTSQAMDKLPTTSRPTRI